MIIRKFKPEDAKEASKILIEAFKTFLGSKVNKKNYSAEVLGRESNRKGKDYEIISYVAEENKEIIGYIRGDANKNGLGSLSLVGVKPDFFNSGAGTGLMRALEKFWKRKKLRKVTTCVSAHNKRALIYYLKNGFIPVGYRKDHFYIGVDEILLDRFLK